MASPESPLHDDLPEFANATDLLRSVSEQYNELEVRALAELYDNMDFFAYKKLMSERAALLANLPTKLEAYKGQGGTVLEQITSIASNWAVAANQCLQADDLDQMYRLMIPKGKTIHDPNLLEELIAYLQPAPAEAP